MQEVISILIPIIIAHVLVLGAIIFIIKKMLMGDTVTAVNRIKLVETEVRKKEEGIRLEIAEHEKEFEKQKAEGEAALEKQRTEMEQDLLQTKEQIVGEAEKEAERITTQAKKEEEKLRHQIAQDMEEKSVEYGGEVFKLVFSEKMNAELNKQFINELLEALDEIEPASITVEGAEAEFTTSHPMDADQKVHLEKLLKDKFDVDVKIEEKIQEDLMGGIILKLGSLEIDGSLINRFKEAAAEVKKSAHV